MSPRIVGHTEICLFLLPLLQQGDFTVEALVTALLADFQVIDRDTIRDGEGCREKVARIIDPDAWLLYDNTNEVTKMQKPVSLWRVEPSLTKADCILAAL